LLRSGRAVPFGRNDRSVHVTPVFRKELRKRMKRRDL